MIHACVGVFIRVGLKSAVIRRRSDATLDKRF